MTTVSSYNGLAMRATSAHSSIQLLFYCLFGTLLLLSRGQEAFAQSPSGSFMYDKRIHDFGRIYERKGTVRHTFTFKNTSSKPIVVDRINVGCSCVEADFPKQPVPAGGKACITVSFNPSGRPGKFSKEVVVMLNGYQEYVRVWIKGEVIADNRLALEDYPYDFGGGLIMSHRVLAFPDIKVGQTGSISLRIANKANHPIDVRLRRVPDNRLLQMPEHISLAPGEAKKIEVTYKAVRSYSYNRHIDIVVTVNGKRMKNMRVTWLPNAH